MNENNHFDILLDMIEDRLNEVGIIKTSEIWKLTGHRFHYMTMTKEFRAIMDIMIEQGKAMKLKNGIWEILKPNTPAYMKSIRNGTEG